MTSRADGGGSREMREGCARILKEYAEQREREKSSAFRRQTTAITVTVKI